MSKTSKRVIGAGIGVAVLAGATYALGGFSTASASFDPSRLATVERSTMVRSVVATGKVEPISKVEIKSKANGIIERLHVEVGDLVKAGQVLAELDKEELNARVREARANLQAAEAGLAGSRAQLEKNKVEAEGPEVQFAERAAQRASELFAQELMAQSELDLSRSAYEQAVNRQRAAQILVGALERSPRLRDLRLGLGHLGA